MDQLAPAVELDALSGILPLERIRVIVYPVRDVGGVTSWWEHVLGVPPHLVGEGFALFDAGRVAVIVATGLNLPESGLACWEVDDVHVAVNLALARGATPCVPMTDIGSSFQIASVTAPDGAVIGFATRSR